VRWWGDGGARLGVLAARTGTTTALDVDGVAFDSLQATGGEGAFRRGLTERLPEVVRGPLDGDLRVLARSGEPPVGADDVSPVRSWTWTDSAGFEVHGFLHPPRRAGVTGPHGGLPPLVVEVHGGPTSRTDAAFTTARHFWTTRGFAVLDVNYSGSTGHGRAYRDRLLGAWGELDIDDCVTGALSLADAGLVDPERLTIRGGSADAFAAGTSLFGVTDLAGLATDTHKFESRYCDRLVAPWPEGAAVYRDRSPVHHADRLHGELLLLQGEDDRVVPLSQAETMAAAMRAAGREVELVVYPGEGHGFRQAASIVDALTRELAFYQRVLGLDGADPG
jgi:dipeptidyl aminopeptidase/acylaminoacyl peptidase